MNCEGIRGREKWVEDAAFERCGKKCEGKRVEEYDWWGYECAYIGIG